MIASRRSFHFALRLESSLARCWSSGATVPRRGRASAALPAGRALLGERAQPFGRVLRLEQLVEQRPRERAQRRRRRRARPTRTTLPAGPHRERRGGDDLRARRPAPRPSAAPGSTSRLTSPSWYARRASMGSPVRMASIAGARPIARGSRNRPPAAAMRLCRTSASPNADRVVATTTSAASTISMPPAVASPSTATTIGFSARGTRSRRTRRGRCRASPRCRSPG